MREQIEPVLSAMDTMNLISAKQCIILSTKRKRKQARALSSSNGGSTGEKSF